MNFKNIVKSEKFILIFIGIIFIIIIFFITFIFFKDNKKSIIGSNSLKLNNEDNLVNQNTNKFKINIDKNINNETKDNINTSNENLNKTIYYKPEIIFNDNFMDYINSLNGIIENNFNIEKFLNIKAYDYNKNLLETKLKIYGIKQNNEKINISYNNILNIPDGVIKIIFEYSTEDNINQKTTKNLEFAVKNGIENIEFNNANLDKPYSNILYDYNLFIDSNATNLNATIKNLNDSLIILNDNDVTKDYNNFNINLKLIDGNNTLVLINKEKKITFNIIRKDYEFNGLKTLIINDKEIKIDNNNSSYDILLDNNNVFIKAIPYSNEAIISFENEINLNNNITKEIKITNDNITKIYKLNFILKEIKLENLEIENFNLNPLFSPDIYEYNLEVDEDVLEVNIKANTTLGKIEGIGYKKLNIGNNTFEIKITNDDIFKIYKININKKEKNIFKRPLVNGKVSQTFHNGIDISSYKKSIYNEDVYASYSGIVANIIKKSKCGGNIIYINHNLNGKNYTTEYAHLKDISVNIGDKVTSFTKIGTVGGNPKIQNWDKCSTGSHLHYAISLGKYQNASKIFKKNTNIMLDYNISNIYNYKGYYFTSRI